MTKMRSEAGDIFDVCIIGAGWSGLLACKYALENRLSVVVLEKRDGLGGVWNYSEDPSIVTVMESTITSSSATVTEASDFPMKKEYGNFIHRKDVMDYLESYARHFGLHRYILFNQTVRHVEKQIVWTTHTQEACYRSKFLVVCAGTVQRKRDEIKEVQEYCGHVTHVGYLKSIPPDKYDRQDNILVYGGGESASDVVELLARTPARVTWAIPDGQHFFRKAVIFDRPAPGEYHQTDPPLDEASSKCIQCISPFARSKPGMRWLCTLGSTGSVIKFEGHGVAEWKKNVPFMHAMINKNGHVVEFIRSMRITPQGKIVTCRDRTVTFQNGCSDDFTHLILCTGYESGFSYLPYEDAQGPSQDNYKLIFYPDDPSLLFIGYARPTVGSIPLMAEAQCMYAFQVLGGKIKLPCKEAMLSEICEDTKQRDHFFLYQRRPNNLVCPFQYGYEIAKLARIDMNYAKNIYRNPIAFLKTFFSPFCSAHLLFNHPEKSRSAVEHIWRRQSMKYFVYPWIYLVARLLKIDAIADFLSERDYMKQIQSRRTSRFLERASAESGTEAGTGHPALQIGEPNRGSESREVAGRRP